MKILGFELRRAEKRGIEDPQTPLTGAQLLAAIQSGAKYAGVNVNAESAIQLAAVYSCVRIISQTLASMPLSAYRRTANGREKADKAPEHFALHTAPNGVINSFIFKEMMLWHLLLHGNFYAEIVRDASGVYLWPIPNTAITPKRAKNGRLFYEFIANGRSIELDPSQVFHVVGPGASGDRGLSPIGVMRKSIGLGIAAEDFGATFFGNGARLSGVLHTDQKLSPEAARRLREDFSALHSGVSNAHRIAVLEQGLDFTSTSVPPEDAQFLETRKYQRSEIAGIFQVPPHLIGDLERATFSNIEHQGIAFVQYCLMPWAARIEAEINRKLFADQPEMFAKFDLAALMRGDMNARYNAYAVGRNNGWLSANEIRALEDLNPIEGGDQYLTPLNMKDANSDDEKGGADPKNTDEKEGDQNVEA